MNNTDDFIIEEGKPTKYTGEETEVVIPDSVKSIRYFAFYNCSSLASITIPNNEAVRYDSHTKVDRVFFNKNQGTLKRFDLQLKSVRIII